MAAKDVRSLSTCILCNEIGTYDPCISVPLLLALRGGTARGGRFKVGAHPRCLVRGDEGHEDIAFITGLGVDEMGKIRREDLPLHLWRRVAVAMDAQIKNPTGDH